MSLNKNIAANYVSQIYVTMIGIAFVPLYIKYMGAEAYGLVGFFAMLQAWFNMLDLGLSPTIARESARYHGSAMTAMEYMRVYRALSIIFVSIALTGGLGLLISAEAIATHWLHLQTLPRDEVVLAIQIMAIIVALRWMSGLYRGVVSGAEKMIFLSVFISFIATLRFVGVLGSMWIWGYTPRVFFFYQLVVALLELVGLLLGSRWLLPKKNVLDGIIGWSFEPVRPLLKFSLTIAFTSSVWIMVTQLDKLVLSGILPLAEYGFFTLAVLVASGIMIISGPVSSAIMPRMARLYAEGKQNEMIYIYRQASKLVVVFAGSVAVVIAFNAESIMLVWTGNADMAQGAGSVLRLYAIGNGILIVGAFPYYLQYAFGNLRYHFIINVGTVFLLVPVIVFSALKYGSLGCAWVWLIYHALGIVTWSGWIHKKMVKGLHLKWLYQDVFFIVLPAIMLSLFASQVLNYHVSRNEIIVKIIVLLLLCLSISMLFKRISEKIYGSSSDLMGS